MRGGRRGHFGIERLKHRLGEGPHTQSALIAGEISGSSAPFDVDGF
jgi:hypothetical protein